MEKKREAEKTPRARGYIFKFSIPFIIGFIFVMIAAAVANMLNPPEIAFEITGCAACLIISYLCAKILMSAMNRQGMVWGILCGVLVFIVLRGLGAIFSDGVRFFSPAALCTLVGGALGGLSGRRRENKNRRKK